MCQSDKPLFLADALQEEMKEVGANTIEERAGYNRIILKDPVGAGKNHFCLHVLPKMATQKPILFITSREATVEQLGRELQEIADSEGFAPSVVFGRIGEQTVGRNFLYGHSWDIENHIAEYKELASRGFFRYIVMDECHSLMTDTVFTSAPLAVLELVEATSSETAVILMSACPERIFKRRLTLDYKMLDYRDCHKAEPKHVEIIKGNTATALLHKAREDNKILYYVASTEKAYKLEKQYNEVGVRATAITSNKAMREKVYQTKQEIDKWQQASGLALESLRERERFPDNVDLIIATTKIREGVNIKDKRVKTIITELRDSVSLIQCSGRVRHGVENFYIIDGSQFFKTKGYQEQYKCGQKQLDNHNRTLCDYKIPDKKSGLISTVTKKLHRGVIYYSEARDTFLLNRFYVPEQEQKWADYEEWKADKVGYIRRVMEREQVAYQIEEEKLIEIIKPYSDRRITTQEKNNLLAELNAVLPLNKQVSKKINTILEKVGYNCKPERDKRHYIIAKI